MMAWRGHLRRFSPWLFHCGSARRAEESSYRHCSEVAETKESAPGSSLHSAWRWKLHRLHRFGPFLVFLHVMCVYLAGLPLVLLHRLHTAAGNDGVVAGRRCFPPLSDVQGRLSALFRFWFALLGEQNQHQASNSDDPGKSDDEPGCLIVLGHAKTACCSYCGRCSWDPRSASSASAVPGFRSAARSAMCNVAAFVPSVFDPLLFVRCLN